MSTSYIDIFMVFWEVRLPPNRHHLSGPEPGGGKGREGILYSTILRIRNKLSIYTPRDQRPEASVDFNYLNCLHSIRSLMVRKQEENYYQKSLIIMNS